jgi:hypothetical protein
MTPKRIGQIEGEERSTRRSTPVAENANNGKIR